MAKNDTFLIDALLDQLQQTKPGADRGDHFEFFVLEQVLKNFDLTQEELELGWTDGSNDGGIDGFYVFVNGRLVADPSDFSWPRTGAEIEVFLITCKHRSTFQQAPLDSMLASSQELFDLSRPTPSLSATYSDDVKRCREVFIASFRQLSLHRPRVVFNIVYASRGETSALGESIKSRAQQLVELFHSYFSGAVVRFITLGPTELVEMHRQIKTFALDLPVQECLTAGDEGYVVLARLEDYLGFVQDSHGGLRRYLFDSNVRAFLGPNPVNADIAETLRNSDGPNFWWLNNGVTILATSASLVGKTLKLRDIQIVNGLQTTESIYRHFSTQEAAQSGNRRVLVKVIVSEDESVRDQVIRATNNQSAVEAAALHATDRIQRSIEEILLRNDWFYERRTNFYRNEGRPDSRIISPLMLASGAVALLMKNPAKSSKFRQKLIRSPEAYSAVFGDHYPLVAWPKVALITRVAEQALTRARRARGINHSNYLSAWRGPLAYFLAVRITGTFSFSHHDVANISPDSITEEFTDQCWVDVQQFAGEIKSIRVGETRIAAIAEGVEKLWCVQGQFAEGKRPFPALTSPPKRASSKPSDELIKTISARLPPQPWKPGVHAIVAKELGVSPYVVSQAIKVLITRGDWMDQRDGVVYDRHGNEVMRDSGRFP